MSELRIELALKKASTDTPFYDRYKVLRHRLFTNEYQHWATGFPHGNNHGEGHIRRVLANLNNILGEGFLRDRLITPYELFLSMMSILYHDVGILGGRKDHADKSAKFFDEVDDAFIIEKRDRDFIRAAIVSHSSSKDIAVEAAQFSESEHIGPDTVRPRVVAALVRLADELDEDYRRADPAVARKIALPEESRFFWEFNQRVLAVKPDPKTREIYIGVQFEPEDALRTVIVDGRGRLFVSAFAEKLGKINGERKTVSRFLPRDLQFQRLLVSIKPLKRHEKWKEPREFIFNDATTSLDFVNAIPELRERPANERLNKIIAQIREDLKAAENGLQELEHLVEDLPSLTRLRVYWDSAIVRSLKAAKLHSAADEQQQELDQGLEYLRKWYELGQASAWREHGLDAANEVYEIVNEKDLGFLYSKRKHAIAGILGVNKRFLVHHSATKGGGGGGGWGGGCIPAGVRIETPKGVVPIEEIQPGMLILSSDLQKPPRRIEVRVLRVHRLSEPVCVLVNGSFRFTASQPLYAGSGKWLRAGELTIGSGIETADGTSCVVRSIARIGNDRDVYSLTADHPTHNFLVSGLVCGNMQKK